jgi:hypothetical protein
MIISLFMEEAPQWDAHDRVLRTAAAGERHRQDGGELPRDEDEEHWFDHAGRQFVKRRILTLRMRPKRVVNS